VIRRSVSVGFLVVVLASLLSGPASAQNGSSPPRIEASASVPLVPYYATKTTTKFSPILANPTASGTRDAALTAASSAPVTATFDVTYTGFSAEAMAAFQAAVDVWDRLIKSNHVIHVNANWTPLASNVLGSASPSQGYLLSGINRFFPAALAEALCNCEGPQAFEINANFNSSFTSWYLGTDGNTPSDKWDLFTVVLHELGHGLGFSGSFNVSGTNGSWGGVADGVTYPAQWDTLEYDAASGGHQLIDTGTYANPGTALKSALTGGSVYYGGANTVAYLGTRAKLYAPSTWVAGTSNAHTDNTAFPPGSLNSLMDPALSNGEVVHFPGPLVIAMFQDLAWSTASIAPKAVISPTSNAYGNVAVGSTSNRIFTVTNTGVTPLHITTASTGNAQMVVNTNLCNGTTVAPLGSCTVAVKFQPTTNGAVATSLSVTSDATNGTVSASLTGTGTQPVASLSPTTWDFGQVQLGSSSASKTFTFSNTGNSSLQLNSVTIDNSDFVIGTNTCGPLPKVIAASGSCAVNVTFHPSATGDLSAALKFTPAAPALAVTASLSGTGTKPVASLSPMAWYFGQVHIGSASASKTFTFSNTGNGPLELDGVSMDNPDFVIGTNTCGPLPKVIAPGGSCTVDVTFHPSDTGDLIASLLFTSAAPAQTIGAGIDGIGLTPADTTGPTVGSIYRELNAPQVIGSTVLLTVQWDAATDPSGIASYQLQRKKGTGAWVAVALPTLTSTSVDVPVTPNAAYTFRLRATDGAANTGPWSTSTKKVTSLIQETATSIVYTGAFKRVTLTGSSGGYVRWTNVAGRIATFTFTGTSAAFVTTTGPSRGIMKVRVDGGSWQAIDLYSASVKTRMIELSFTGITGLHTLGVQVTGTKNVASSSVRVDIDAFLVQP